MFRLDDIFRPSSVKELELDTTSRCCEKPRIHVTVGASLQMMNENVPTINKKSIRNAQFFYDC